MIYPTPMYHIYDIHVGDSMRCTEMHVKNRKNRKNLKK